MTSTLGLRGAAILSTSRAPVRMPWALLLPQIARCWAIYAGAFFLVAVIHNNSRNIANLKRTLLRPPYFYGVPALGAVVGLFTVLPKMV